MSSFRIVPESGHPTSFNPSSIYSAPSAPGVPDLLRSRIDPTGQIDGVDRTTSTTTSLLDGSSSSSSSVFGQSAADKPGFPTNDSVVTGDLVSTHPLEARLKQWKSVQHNQKMSILRNTYGIAEPVRREMELSLVRSGEWAPALLGGSAHVHRDILDNREADIGWEDVFKGSPLSHVPDFHSEMEHNFRMK